MWMKWRKRKTKKDGEIKGETGKKGNRSKGVIEEEEER